MDCVVLKMSNELVAMHPPFTAPDCASAHAIGFSTQEINTEEQDRGYYYHYREDYCKTLTSATVPLHQSM